MLAFPASRHLTRSPASGWPAGRCSAFSPLRPDGRRVAWFASGSRGGCVSRFRCTASCSRPVGTALTPRRRSRRRGAGESSAPRVAFLPPVSVSVFRVTRCLHMPHPPVFESHASKGAPRLSRGLLCGVTRHLDSSRGPGSASACPFSGAHCVSWRHFLFSRAWGRAHARLPLAYTVPPRRCQKGVSPLGARLGKRCPAPGRSHPRALA